MSPRRVHKWFNVHLETVPRLNDGGAREKDTSVSFHSNNPQ
jgi:hypothetical protein